MTPEQPIVVSQSRSTVELVAIPPHGVLAVWPIVDQYLDRACRRTKKVSMFSLYGDLVSDPPAAQLWVVWDTDGESLAAIVTDIAEYPSGYRTVRVLLTGGKSLELWLQVIETLKDYTRAEGCAALEIIGRPGWAKKFPEFREIERTLAFEVENG